MDISNNCKQGNMALSMKKIKNLQQNIFKKAEEQEIKLPTFSESWRKQGSSRKTSTSASLTMLKPLCASQQTVKTFLKRWEYHIILPGSWETYMQGQEATVRMGHGTTDWFQIGKGAHQGCILSPCLLNFYAEYIKWNAGVDKTQAGIKIATRNINNLRYADDTILTTENKDELKNLLMKVKEESERASLKLNI